MIEADRIDGHEARQIVLERHIVAVPGDHIEWRMLLQRHQQSTLIFRHHTVNDIGAVAVLKPGGRRLEVARIRQTVGADRPKIGQLEVVVVHFENVAAARRESVVG